MANSKVDDNILNQAKNKPSKPQFIKESHRPLMATSPTQRQGSYFEQLACEYLQRQGLHLIAQNWQQSKISELDLVMLQTGSAWSTLVFIEVRQRQHSNFGDAALSVTASKQRKIIKTAQYFLQQNPEYADYNCRFDVIAYNIDKATINESSLKSAVTAESVLNTDINANFTAAYQPEWLINAFIATAW